MNRIRVAIVGGSGYTGAELLRLLVSHPEVELVAVTSRAEAGRLVADEYVHLRGYSELRFSAPDSAVLGSCDAVFYATPHGAAMDSAPEVLEAGARVIDLSADFRLRDAQLWAQWYDREHAAPDLLDSAIYGLPEINREAIRGARLVACPGCYPTAVQLSLAPVLRAGMIRLEGIIADCKSGVSGAGRVAKKPLLLAEASDNFHAYASSGHRHLPEIEQGLGAIAGAPVELSFVPHLLPIIRGIHATVYAELTDSAEAAALYADFYRDEPFVDVMSAGSHPETRSVRGSNMARLAVQQLGRRLIILTVIDNLVKGASGQAVQCMNLMFGLAETSGLQAPALLP